MPNRSIALTLASTLVAAGSPSIPALAQGPARPHVEVPTIAPRPEDVGSIDGIIKAFYEVVSGPKGQPRQWGRDRTLYIPDVRFVSTGVRERDSSAYAQVMSHQQFVDGSNESMVSQGFFETEIHRVTQRFGNVAHIFSTYDMRASENGPSLGRGVNSIELVWDGKRWWIASAVWDDERPGNEIPKEWLPGK